MPGNIRKQKVSQKTLLKLAKKPRIIRAGATKNIGERTNQYKNEGYSGTAYFAKTTNMMKAENKLLSMRPYAHNVHKKSNSSNENGFVYLFEAKKYQS